MFVRKRSWLYDNFPGDASHLRVDFGVAFRLIDFCVKSRQENFPLFTEVLTELLAMPLRSHACAKSVLSRTLPAPGWYERVSALRRRPPKRS